MDVVEKVTEYIIKKTTKDDEILAIPSSAAYYFLTDRLNPTRFDLFGLIVTDRHRLEVVEDIRRERPVYVIYDTAMPLPDGIPDEIQFPEALSFIKENYTLEKRFGKTLILRRIDYPLPLRGRFISDRLGWKGKERNAFYAFFWNQPALYQYDLERLDEKALFDFFHKKGIRTAYILDFYLSERLTRQSGEHIIFSPPYGERLSGYAAIVDSDPSHTFVFTEDEDQDFGLMLSQAGASFKKDKIGGFAVYHSVRFHTEGFDPISRDGWKASSSHNPESADKAFDRDVYTRWFTGKNQEPGMWYQLDTGDIHRISRIVMIQGFSPPDSPRGFEILISIDGGSWSKVAENKSFKGISVYREKGKWKLDPSGKMDIIFPEVKARYIKIIQKGDDPFYNWSIAEIFIYRKGKSYGMRDKLDDLYNAAERDVEEKRYDLAIKKYHEIISKRPDHDAAHQALNRILMRIGLSHDIPPYKRGRFFEERGMWNSAVLEDEKAIKESHRGYASEIIERLLRTSMNLNDDKRVSLYRERLRKDFTPERIINANFEGRIEFMGYEIDSSLIKTGERLRITYYWRCLKEMKEDYAIFVHILRDGKIALQNDHYPLDKAHMTSQWRPGEMIRETYEIYFPDGIEKGIYIIRLGIWEPLKGRRLKVIAPDRKDRGDSILIGEIMVG